MVNYYTSCGTEMWLMAVDQLLDFRNQNFPEKQWILDALTIATISNTCNFMGRYFTQIYIKIFNLIFLILFNKNVCNTLSLTVMIMPC